MTAHKLRDFFEVFPSSVCPDTSIGTLIIFTIFSILWIVYQLFLRFSSLSASSRSRKQPPELRAGTRAITTHKVVISLLYVVIYGILLVDGCWVAMINSWKLQRIYSATTLGFVAELLATPLLVVEAGFLLVGIAVWLWTFGFMWRQLLQTWHGPNTFLSRNYTLTTNVIAGVAVGFVIHISSAPVIYFINAFLEAIFGNSQNGNDVFGEKDPKVLTATASSAVYKLCVSIKNELAEKATAKFDVSGTTNGLGTATGGFEGRAKMFISEQAAIWRRICHDDYGIDWKP